MSEPSHHARNDVPRESSPAAHDAPSHEKRPPPYPDEPRENSPVLPDTPTHKENPHDDSLPDNLPIAPFVDPPRQTNDDQSSKSQHSIYDDYYQHNAKVGKAVKKCFYIYFTKDIYCQLQEFF